jgi:hypothetical protein
MAIQKKQIIQPADLGKGLSHNSLTELIDVKLSSDSNNSLEFGNDNGLYLDVTNKFDVPTGTSTQYVAGDGSIMDFPTTIEILLNELTDDYAYFGGILSTGGWQINKWTISTNVKTVATQLNNSSKTTLTTAWADRTTLTYN